MENTQTQIRKIAFEDAIAIIHKKPLISLWVDTLKAGHHLLGSSEPFSLALGTKLLPLAQQEILRQKPELEFIPVPLIGGLPEHEQVRIVHEWRDEYAPPVDPKRYPHRKAPLVFDIASLH